MKKYKTEKYRSIQITEVEVIRETAASVVLATRYGAPNEREHMDRKATEYTQYHDTWEAAHACLLDRTETKLKWARDALQKAQSDHGNVKGMKRPVNPAEESK